MNMWTSEVVIRELRRRGDLIEHAPGLLGLRGDAGALFRRLEARLAAIAREEADEDWHVPPAIGFDLLARAGYFESFPHWLTAAAHLGAEDAAPAQVAASRDPAADAVRALRPAPVALLPAVCYQAYAALRGSILHAPLTVTLQGTCWRREAGGFAPLERGWAFTMREIVCAGDAAAVDRLRTRGAERTRRFAESIGLRPELAQANDPFFAPAARGRALMQQLKALKHELRLPLGGGHTVAAASFNGHERWFGEAFDIRLAGGARASTACVAFGVERWTLAFLVAHGVDAAGWPAVVPPRATAARTEAA